MWADTTAASGANSFETWRQAGATQAQKAARASFTLANLQSGGTDLLAFTQLSTFYGNCDGGYICLEGSTTATPTVATLGRQCPAGSYCPSGAITEIPCPPGFYQDEAGKESCKAC